MTHPHNPTLTLLLVILLAVVTWGHEPTRGPKGSDSHGAALTGELVTAKADPHQPIQGVTGKGSAFVLYRSETGLVREFTMILPAGKGDRG